MLSHYWEIKRERMTEREGEQKKFFLKNCLKFSKKGKPTQKVVFVGFNP